MWEVQILTNNGSRHSFIVESSLGFTRLMTQHQLNFLLRATTTCLSAYCQTVTTFSTTYCLTRLIDRRHNRSLCVKADEKNFLIREFLRIHIRLLDYYYCTIHVLFSCGLSTVIYSFNEMTVSCIAALSLHLFVMIWYCRTCHFMWSRVRSWHWSVQVEVVRAPVLVCWNISMNLRKVKCSLTAFLYHNTLTSFSTDRFAIFVRISALL